LPPQGFFVVLAGLGEKLARFTEILLGEGRQAKFVGIV